MSTNKPTKEQVEIARSDLYKSLQIYVDMLCNKSNVFIHNKPCILEFIYKYNIYLDNISSINSIVTQLQGIQSHYNYLMQKILSDFVESDELKIKDLIESKLNIENQELKQQNKELQSKNIQYSGTIKAQNKIVANYNSDGSSKVAIENAELKDKIHSLQYDIRNLKSELTKLNNVKQLINQIK